MSLWPASRTHQGAGRTGFSLGFAPVLVLSDSVPLRPLEAEVLAFFQMLSNTLMPAAGSDSEADETSLTPPDARVLEELADVETLETPLVGRFEFPFPPPPPPSRSQIGIIQRQRVIKTHLVIGGAVNKKHRNFGGHQADFRKIGEDVEPR